MTFNRDPVGESSLSEPPPPAATAVSAAGTKDSHAESRLERGEDSGDSISKGRQEGADADCSCAAADAGVDLAPSRGASELLVPEPEETDRTGPDAAADAGGTHLRAPPRASSPCRESSTISSTARGNDPHNLIERFVRPQGVMFAAALNEIREGGKQTCWLWFVLPTAPYVVGGVERGSTMNRHYALRTDEEVEAYLRLAEADDGGGGGGVDLRKNYLQMLAAVEDQLRNGRTMLALFGPMDEAKATSSFRLFRRISEAMGDGELCTLCQRVLALVDRKGGDTSGGDGVDRTTKRSWMNSW